jgi:hypothetical protein
VGDGGVAAPAVEADADVEADDIPLFELAGTGDAVDHLGVDRDAGAGGEGDLAGDPLEERDAAGIGDGLLDRRVDLGRRHPRPDELRGLLVGLPDDQARLPHLLDLGRSLLGDAHRPSIPQGVVRCRGR